MHELYGLNHLKVEFQAKIFSNMSITRGEMEGKRVYEVENETTTDR